MRLKKKECLLQSTERGQINWTVGFGFLLFMGLLLCVLLQIDIFCSSARYMEDALAASNLAAAVIDVEEYGVSHRLLVEEPSIARERCMTAMKTNLGLNDNWECANQKLISGSVRLLDFTVYIVSGNNVEIYKFDENGLMTEEQGSLGQVTAPDGAVVKSTGIYSEIAYKIKAFLNVEVPARKGKLVEVVENE